MFNCFLQTEPVTDLWLRCGDQHNHSQKRKTRIQVNQEVASCSTVQVHGWDQKNHQAVDQSQKGGEKALEDKEEGQEAHWPLAAWCRGVVGVNCRHVCDVFCMSLTCGRIQLCYTGHYIRVPANT